jgi:hypothetical protein
MRENEGCLVRKFCFFRLKRLKVVKLHFFVMRKDWNFFFLGGGGGVLINMGKTQGVYFVPCLRQKILKMREIQYVMTNDYETSK